MYCPQCGQQQVSEITRFCSRCGFPLDGVATVLATGGAVPTRYVQPSYKELSPRSKGVRQGALMMLSTLLLVPLVAIIAVGVLGLSGAIVAITAVMCFLGGLLRILYALLMEEPVAPNSELTAGYPHAAVPQFGRSVQNPALPPASVNASTAWRPRPNTAEIYQPPSVTENTTRLLDKDEQKNR